MIISRIIEEKKKAIEQAKSTLSLDEITKKLEGAHQRHHRFTKEISKEHHINLIAEIKKASPSKGVLRKDFDPVKIACAYQMNGASALSILTEEKFFLGKLEYIKKVKEAVDLPILRKDFIIDPYQIYESAFYGAEAVLLIADILSEEELKGLYSLSRKVGLDTIVEVHNEEDLKKALLVDAKVIGINNRDLHSFNVDLGVTTRLIKAIPEGKIIVSESGIKSHEDVMFLKSIGTAAVLIGEAFMTTPDIGTKVRELMGT